MESSALCQLRLRRRFSVTAGKLAALLCILVGVTGKRNLRKIALVMALMAGVLALIGGMSAEATPIRPDLRKLLEQVPDQNPQFAPARAGWEGPEAAKTPESSPNPVLEKFSPVASARAARASLITAAIPDWRIALALLALILFLRKFREGRDATPASTLIPETTELKPAA